MDAGKRRCAYYNASEYTFSQSLVELIMLSIILKFRKMIVFIDLLHFRVFAALYQNAAAWDQCAGSADDLKGKIQNLSRCNICPTFCSVLQLRNILAKLSNQNKMNRVRLLESTRLLDFCFR